MFLLNNNSSLTEDETAEISKLQDEFPYSQAIHNLVARGAQLNNLGSKQTQLNIAAVYSTDRAVLKSLVTALKGERKAQRPEPVKATEVTAPVDPIVEKKVESQPQTEKPKSAEKVDSSFTKEVEKPVVTETPPAFKSQPVDLSGDALVSEVFSDIEKLKKSKHNFELVADGFGLPMHPDPTPIETKEEPVTEKKTENKKSKKEPTDGLIAEIKSTKKKIKPVDPRQKEQLDIIDNFIKSKPSIAKKSRDNSTAAQTDLSEGSAVFSDNIISETLVEILIKQGKKEKAVEVLKKLIWKFPQKKAYFAAQIEELTK